MSNIHNHNRLPFNFRLDRSEYWDFFLGEPSYGAYDGMSDGCMISFIDTTDPDCIQIDNLFSKREYYWENAVNNGLTLKNIGYTGVDNGLIHYEKDRISNKQFLELYKHSEIIRDKDDVRLILNKVRGNNQIFSYDNDFVEEDGMIVAKLNGGFFQGFFKTDENYRVLPSNLGSGMTFEVVLKKHDFEKDSNFRLNDRYNENKGIFLYIGTRAENKWWKEYNNEYEPAKIENGYVASGYVNPEYTDTSHLNDDYQKELKDLYVVSEYVEDGYLTDECEKGWCYSSKSDNGNSNYKPSSGMPKFTYPEALNVYEDNAVWFDQEGHLWVENELFTTNRLNSGGSCNRNGNRKCNCDSYFADGYVTDNYYSGTCNCDLYFREDYLNPEAKIDVNEELVMSDGYSIWQPNIKEYKTDNKFLMFDRTCDGYTTDNWVEGTEVIITDVMTPKIKNYYLLFDRTCNGYTTENIDKLISEESKRYNILTDIYRNAIAFQIDDNGRIGYKYLVKDCDNEDGYKVETEMSSENIILNDKWNTVTVKILPLTRNYDVCDNSTSPSDNMKIVIYVNGKLRFVSKELPVLNLRELNDMYSKQEGVPFNISLGGGTQGLCDVIYLNYRELPKYALPLEKAFAGTFNGYIKVLRIYNCDIPFSQIGQNAIFDSSF